MFEVGADCVGGVLVLIGVVDVFEVVYVFVEGVEESFFFLFFFFEFSFLELFGLEFAHGDSLMFDGDFDSFDEPEWMWGYFCTAFDLFLFLRPKVLSSMTFYCFFFYAFLDMAVVKIYIKNE